MNQLLWSDKPKGDWHLYGVGPIAVGQASTLWPSFCGLRWLRHGGLLVYTPWRALRIEWVGSWRPTDQSVAAPQPPCHPPWCYCPETSGVRHCSLCGISEWITDGSRAEEASK